MRSRTRACDAEGMRMSVNTSYNLHYNIIHDLDYRICRVKSMTSKLAMHTTASTHGVSVTSAAAAARLRCICAMHGCNILALSL